MCILFVPLVCILMGIMQNSKWTSSIGHVYVFRSAYSVRFPTLASPSLFAAGKYPCFWKLISVIWILELYRNGETWIQCFYFANAIMPIPMFSQLLFLLFFSVWYIFSAIVVIVGVNLMRVVCICILPKALNKQSFSLFSHFPPYRIERRTKKKTAKLKERNGKEGGQNCRIQQLCCL